jgi:hypothetical protein
MERTVKNVLARIDAVQQQVRAQMESGGAMTRTRSGNGPAHLEVTPSPFTPREVVAERMRIREEFKALSYRTLVHVAGREITTGW